jgi:hypothetical protein
MDCIKFFLTSLILLSFSSVNSQSNHDLDCSKFKNGTFEMNLDGMKIITDRNEEIQIEKSKLGFSKYKVNWKSDCEYELELTETNLEFMENSIGWVFQVKIMDTKENEYTYECRVEGIDFVQTGVNKKIKD